MSVLVVIVPAAAAAAVVSELCLRLDIGIDIDIDMQLMDGDSGCDDYDLNKVNRIVDRDYYYNENNLNTHYPQSAVAVVVVLRIVVVAVQRTVMVPLN